MNLYYKFTEVRIGTYIVFSIKGFLFINLKIVWWH